MKKQLYFLSTLIVVFLSINAVVPFLTQGHLDIGHLDDYESPYVPDYIFNEQTQTDTISDEIATLGRVLFYDNHLSLNESISCASCHKQEFAFGDTLIASPGFDKKLTERHSTRLVNLNFSHMPEVFWDRRAGHLDSLPLMVLSNSIEMGFSGKDGQPDIDSLVSRLGQVDYLEPLFDMAYGSSDITAEKVNLALTQFVRSIVSYDSKYDIARSMVDSARQKFPLFTEEENLGKDLYFSPFGEPESFNGFVFGLANNMGCAECHGIDNFTTRKTSLTGNNGIIGVIGHPGEIDTTVKRSPSLRDLVSPEGIEIGPFMHDGSLSTLEKVVDHYSKIGLRGHPKPIGLHTSLNIDTPNGTYSGASGPSGPQGPMTPRLSQEGKDAIVAFLKTLTGRKIYTEEKWSNPFNENNELTITDFCMEQSRIQTIEICEGEEYHGYHLPGRYTIRKSQVGQCDSNIIIDLKIKPMVRVYIDTTICDSDLLYGYRWSGEYIDHFPNVSGCDTIRYLTISRDFPQFQNENLELCAGQEYRGITDYGIVFDTIQNIRGCDSIRITTTVRINRPENERIDTTICHGESFDGYSENGTYYYDAMNDEGCLVRRRLKLKIQSKFEKVLKKEICDGESYRGHNTTGMHEEKYSSIYGCDSIIYVDLSVIPSSESRFDISICDGETYEGYSQSGSYIDQLINRAGCDSTRYINLEVKLNSESYTQIDLCKGEDIEGYTISGLYTDILSNSAGCDSTRVIDLKILHHTESYYNPSICLGETYAGYNSSGNYIDVLKNFDGCDSTRHINLTVLHLSESYEESHICPGENYEGYTEGEHYELYTNAVGCDSLRVINVVEISPEDVICIPDYEQSYQSIDDSEYISVYPNPVTDILNVSIDKQRKTSSTLRLYGPKHNLILTQELDSQDSQIDVSQLPSGIYVAHISSGHNRFVGKILKI